MRRGLVWAGVAALAVAGAIWVGPLLVAVWYTALVAR